MYVLLGELPGDYDDFYERPVEVLACANSESQLVDYYEGLEKDSDCEYVDFRIESAPLL